MPPTKKTNEVDSWNRFPEVKFRMREDGIETLLEGLGEDGFCHGSEPKFHLMDDGIYVEILLNVGKHGSIVALPFEVFIPAKIPVSKKKIPKEEVVAEAKEAVVEEVNNSSSEPTET